MKRSLPNQETRVMLGCSNMARRGVYLEICSIMCLKKPKSCKTICRLCKKPYKAFKEVGMKLV